MEEIKLEPREEALLEGMPESVDGVPKAKLTSDLIKYKKRALELGASDAIIAPASHLVLTRRGRYGCTFTHCAVSRLCYFCPPSFPITFEESVAIRDSYHYIIMIRVPVDPRDYTGPQSIPQYTDQYAEVWHPDRLKYWRDYGEKHPGTKGRRPTHALQLEKEARNDGYHYAFAARSGSCSTRECHGYGSKCAALLDPAICRHPSSARPDGAAGMFTDFPRILENYPEWRQVVIGFSRFPEDMPEECKYSRFCWTGII